MSKCEDCRYYTTGEETYCSYDWCNDINCTDYDKFMPKEPIPKKHGRTAHLL